MFSKNVLYVEIFSLELCQKTGKWVESLRQKNDENFGQLLQERREISDCGIRLLQVIVYFPLSFYYENSRSIVPL